MNVPRRNIRQGLASLSRRERIILLCLLVLVAAFGTDYLFTKLYLERNSELKEAAQAQWRTLSNLIETAALRNIREEQFVDDAEMAEISSNESLLKRMRRGSREARSRKGRFVE